MFGVQKTRRRYLKYMRPRDLAIKFGIYSISVLLFFNIFRKGIPELTLFQLYPGYYLNFIICSISLFVLISDFWFRIPLEADTKRPFGIRTLLRLNRRHIAKYSGSFFLVAIVLGIFLIVPISIESLVTLSQPIIESVWSFDSINRLSNSLIFLFINLCQIPIYFIQFGFRYRNEIRSFYDIIRDFVFFISLFCAVITPTVDIPTQLCFMFACLFFYFLVVGVGEKKLTNGFQYNICK